MSHSLAGRAGSLGLLLVGLAVPLASGTSRDAVMRTELPRLQTDYRITLIAAAGPETALCKDYYERLSRMVRYIEKDLKDWPAEPGAKFHRTDSSEEPGVRQNAKVAFSLAVLAAYGDFDESRAGVSRARVRADAIALIRQLSVTHVANFLPTSDGKPWGDQWQSAYWAACAGAAAWLVWADLPDEVKVMVARLVTHEADRFNQRPPDNGESGDTKSEENAWNSEVIALAACMFAHHPNAALWRERAIVYMVNSYSTEADHQDEHVRDGRRIRDWVCTTNIHPDFTLENHFRVHPDYLSCFTLNLHNATWYRFAGLEPPAATFHHARDCHEVLKSLTATNGSLLYINGQDWWPHRHEVTLSAEGLANVYFADAEAASLERGALGTLGQMQARFLDGQTFDRKEVGIPSANEELMLTYAQNYLAHRYFGDGPAPLDPAEFQRRHTGTRSFERGGFVLHRTPDKFVSFCWVNEVMGLVYPGEDTWLVSPQERGLIGAITVAGAKDDPPTVERHFVGNLHLAGPASDDGFIFVGKLARCEHRVEQRIAVISLPDAPVIYVEQLRARQSVDVREIATGTVSLLNENALPITSNERVIWTEEGEHHLRGETGGLPESHVWRTRWANLDDRLGIAAAGSEKMLYLANHKYRRARITQTLSANYAPEPGPREAGDLITECVLGLVPNASHVNREPLTVKRAAPDVYQISFGKWRARVDLTDAKLQSPDSVKISRN